MLDDLVDFSDFLPTLMDLADAPIPEGMPCDGAQFFAPVERANGAIREIGFFVIITRVLVLVKDHAGQFAREASV